MSPIDFNGYQTIAQHTAVYPEDKELEYLTLGLTSESGEVADKVKKYLRGDYDGKLAKEERIKWDIVLELGDVLWYVAMLAKHFDMSLEAVAMENLNKLNRRLDNGKIKGSGDNR